jgi:hypothetical protein
MTDAQRSRIRTGAGALLVALGLLLLAQQLFGFTRNGAWPFYIIAVGLAFFAGAIVGGPAAGPLAIPGAVISTVGLILLYQSTFDRYQTWAYAWSLLVVAGGVGLLLDAAWRNQPERAQVGRAMIGVGVALFVVGFVFFELALNFSGWTNQLPSGLGAFLLLRRSGAGAPPRCAWGTSSSCSPGGRFETNVVDLLLLTALAEHWRRRGAPRTRSRSCRASLASCWPLHSFW